MYLTCSCWNSFALRLLFFADLHACTAKKSTKKTTHTQFQHPHAQSQTRFGVDYITPQVCCANWCHRLMLFLCPWLRWTNEAWLEMWMSFAVIGQQRTVTHPRCVHGVGDGHLLFIWSWLLFPVCRTGPALHTQTWSCRHEHWDFFEILGCFFFGVILNGELDLFIGGNKWKHVEAKWPLIF